MSFEEASTLASVYLIALYSLCGLRCATIQLCQYIGAQIFAGAGTPEKRAFLSDKSCALTQGHGVDVILNWLTGDLIDESWRCIANGGTMAELDKRDMLDRNTFSMEPFGRNTSYRCFDMSHVHVSDALIARLPRQLFALLHAGHVCPVAPITVFPFEDIPAAIRHMRSASHIRKIVISKSNAAGGSAAIRVPVHLCSKPVRLRNDVAYLIDDVAVESHVRRAIQQVPLAIRGFVQGAIDKIFTSTITEYHQAIASKVQGTWDMHNILPESHRTNFFTMRSSISGIVGQRGQPNYAAANAFLDAFAAYRHSLNLPAHTVDLGAIRVQDLDAHQRRAVLTDLRGFATAAARSGKSGKCRATQLVTSIAIPQDELSSGLLRDARFWGLCFIGEARSGAGAGTENAEENSVAREIQPLMLLVKSGAEFSVQHQAVVQIVSRQLRRFCG
ncbi:KR domain-containing protein [Aspergillus pseudoustus]|uniref:KR domain-containing protein n=1 Tax=Aspergillus pseudoustus TaxID=1810923 RepID=A0ABR4KFZ9_9EURO